MVISRTDSIAANSRSANILAGEAFEFLPARSRIRVRSTSAAVGVRMDFSVGGEVLAANALVPPTNRYPLDPEDLVLQVAGVQGERLFLTYLNTTGAAIVTQTSIDVLPF